MKFINTVMLVENENNNYESQLDYDTQVLGATVKYMANCYAQIFGDLDLVLKAYNKTVNKINNL